jgi:hypothetical protein
VGACAAVGGSAGRVNAAESCASAGVDQLEVGPTGASIAGATDDKSAFAEGTNGDWSDTAFGLRGLTGGGTYTPGRPRRTRTGLDSAAAATGSGGGAGDGRAE